jgi:hypothetical protein
VNLLGTDFLFKKKHLNFQNLKFDAGSQDSQGLEEEGKVSG